ncbi:MAG: ectoine/hydroxyectoine ABC transporter substrate-binding protein EhuB [Pseudonocardia sp.]|nr:ectoine/hydroxyectoine ABC transporter substrate-binding protein EhuB [Pseudonocardia sp.]
MAGRALSRRGLLGGAAGLVVLATGLVACSKTEGGPGSTDLLATIKERGYARLGVANELPYSFAGADGVVQGVEPEVAQAVLKRLGVGEAKGVVGTFASMIPSLQAGQIDIICAALFMKESRCATVLFSEPDAVSDDAFAVAPTNPKGIRAIKDLAATKARVSVVGGTLEASTLEQHGIKDQALLVQDNKAGVEALTAGRVDAYLGPSLTIHEISRQGGAAFDVVRPVPEIPVTGAAVAFRKQDVSFRDRYNAELAKLKESGEFNAILSKWGFDPEIAKKTTAAELCQTKG